MPSVPRWRSAAMHRRWRWRSAALHGRGPASLHGRRATKSHGWTATVWHRRRTTEVGRRARGACSSRISRVISRLTVACVRWWRTCRGIWRARVVVAGWWWHKMPRTSFRNSRSTSTRSIRRHRRWSSIAVHRRIIAVARKRLRARCTGAIESYVWGTTTSTVVSWVSRSDIVHRWWRGVRPVSRVRIPVCSWWRTTSKGWRIPWWTASITIARRTIIRRWSSRIRTAIIIAWWRRRSWCMVRSRRTSVATAAATTGTTTAQLIETWWSAMA
mmetsp:Transcript_25723/g.37975  ORF Transcript_25723/g.37975 Transcript_25723/m.37975 type:complete len:272 (-) Transcript_25723:1852-2667(-)